MGTVSQLYSTPLKTGRIVPTDELRLAEGGIVGDREFVVVEPGSGRRISALDEPRMLAVVATWKARELTLAFPDGSSVTGASDDAEAVPCAWYADRDAGTRRIEGPFAAALSFYLGREVILARLSDPCRSFAPVGIVSRASVDAVSPGLDLRVLRMSIVLDGLPPFGEDGWIGRSVSIGSARIEITQTCPRCAITTRDPDTGERGTDTLRAIRDTRGLSEAGDLDLGVYGRVLVPGVVRIGDEVVV